MGYIADYYTNLSLDAESELQAKAEEIYEGYKKGALVWKTKNGNKILVSNMTDSHIKNSINFFSRNKDYVYRDAYTSAIIDVLKMELKKRTIKIN